MNRFPDEPLQHPNADDGARRAFCARIKSYAAAGKPIIYIDESGFAHDMPRPGAMRGYAGLCAQRPALHRHTGLECARPYQRHWGFAGGALLAGVLLTLGLTASNIDAFVGKTAPHAVFWPPSFFNLWLRQDLIPKLAAGSVLVMDNATFHKRNDTEALIVSAGHSVDCLPAYSPDLNKIEPKWAQAKAIRRKTGKTVDEIFSQKF